MVIEQNTAGALPEHLKAYRNWPTPEFLHREIVVAYGMSRHEKLFINQRGTVGALLQALGKYRFGEKDGECLLQGEVLDGGDGSVESQQERQKFRDLDRRGGHLRKKESNRKKTQMIRNWIVMLDIDTGMLVQEAVEKALAKGLFALIWTTYSNGKDVTEINEGKLAAFAKKAGLPMSPDIKSAEMVTLVTRYLAEEKRYLPRVLASVAILEHKLIEGGTHYIVKHEGLPKLRILLVLKEPFEFTGKGLQADRIKLWERGYKAVSEWLGVPYDTSCVDPSRLMYTPALKGPEVLRDVKPVVDHEIIVIDGGLLDFESVASTWKDSTAKASPRSAGYADGIGRDLVRFAAKYPDTDFVAAIKELDPDGERPGGTDDKTNWRCPNEESHTEQSDDDTAFMVKNATDEGAWTALCLHDGCKRASDGDRLWYVQKALEKAGKDVSFLRQFSETARAADAEASAAVNAVAAGQHETVIGALTANSTVQEINAALKLIAAISDPMEKEAALSVVKRNTKNKVPLNVMRKAMDAFTEAQKAALGLAAATVESDPRIPEPTDAKDAKDVWSHWAYRKQLHALRHIVERNNNKDARLFISADNKPMFVVKTMNGCRMIDATVDTTAPYLVDTVTYKHIDRTYGEVIDDRPSSLLIRDLVNLHDPAWAYLEGMSYTPLVDKDGAQITKPGYVKSLNRYLDTSQDWLDLPDDITDADVASAVATLLEPIRDFPFSDAFGGDDPHPIYLDEVDEDGHPLPNPVRGPFSRANCLAFMIQPLARHFFVKAPAYVILKPRPGTGAGYLADVGSIIATGQDAVIETMSDDNESLRKAITATLRDGSPMIFIDNINRRVDSGDLAAALTAGTWKDRILGETKTTTIPIRNTWLLAGNGMSFTDEIADRLVPILLDSNTADPRRDRPKDMFKHHPLQAAVKRERPYLVQAANILIANWVRKGAKPGSVGMASFDDYSAVMSGILEAAGVQGFLGNVRAFIADTATSESKSARPVLIKLLEIYKDQEFTAPEAAAFAVNPMTRRLWGDEPPPVKYDRDGGVDINSWSQCISKPPMLSTPFAMGERKFKLVRREAHGGFKYRFIEVR